MKKIMFNDKYGLTAAVLQGRKTMTRRMVSVPEYWHEMWVWGFAFDEQSHSLRLYDADEGVMEDPETGECAYIFPKYKIGEVVAVAQNYHDVYEELKRTHGSSSRVTREFFHNYVQGGRMPVSNKMFVRADLMPHKIRITDIKVERLQDISVEDCFKEGIYKDITAPERYQPFYTFVNSRTKDNTPIGFDEPQLAFAALIDKVSGRGTWESNPHVFAYTFEKIK